MSDVFDVIIIGGGIAAHTAALYTARASLSPLVISGLEPDQLSLTTLVENFPGFPEGILGPQLVDNAKTQAKKFGATYLTEAVTAFTKTDNGFDVTAGGKTYRGRTVIVATGASARWLGVLGEAQYVGRGVSICATCDAAFYRNKTTVVVGGGDSAMEEAMALYKVATSITIIHRKNEFRASKIMQDRVLALTDKIKVIWDSEVTEVIGNGTVVTGVKIKNVVTGAESEVPTDGVFLAIGHTANTKLFSGTLDLDEHGYIITNKRSQTNISGVFAAGDVADPIFRQAITSAGSGCQSAIEAERYIEHLKAEGKY